jgi:two-component system LytT family response regulator
LLKPVEKPRLEAALLKAEAALAARAELAGAAGSRGAPGSPSPGAAPLERAFVRDGERCWLVSLREVPLIESEGNFARLFLPGAQPLLARSLQYLEARLDPRVFFRASRRHIINLEQVERIAQGLDGRLIVELRSGLHVEMSRRQSQRFKERMAP